MIELTEPGRYVFRLSWDYGCSVSGTITREREGWWVLSSESHGPNCKFPTLKEATAYLDEYQRGAGSLYQDDPLNDRSFIFESFEGEYFCGHFIPLKEERWRIFLVDLGYVRDAFDSLFGAENYVRSGAFLDAHYTRHSPTLEDSDSSS